MKETNQAKFTVEKVIKKKDDKLYVIWKGYDKSFNELIKKISLYKMSYFPEPNTHSKDKIKVALDLSSYASKSDLKSATGVDAS